MTCLMNSDFSFLHVDGDATMLTTKNMFFFALESYKISLNKLKQTM